MSTLITPTLVSTASTESAGKIPAKNTHFLRMPALWRDGQATVARVCIAISCKGIPTSGSYVIGSLADNFMVGFCQADTGAAVAPPAATSNALNIQSESRNLIGYTYYVGNTALLYQSGTNSVTVGVGAGSVNNLQPRANYANSGGLSIEPILSHAIQAGLGIFTGDPETGSDTSFNVAYVTITVTRYDATRFYLKLNWAGSGGAIDGGTKTPAQIISDVEGRADGTITPSTTAVNREYTCTTNDPSEVFADFPYFCFHNPLSVPVYVLHSAAFASV